MVGCDSETCLFVVQGLEASKNICLGVGLFSVNLGVQVLGTSKLLKSYGTPPSIYYIHRSAVTN